MLNIREYVSAIRTIISIEQKDAFNMWEDWALKCADEIDPIKRTDFKNL